jgi:iron complex transport system substrate-binding protein
VSSYPRRIVCLTEESVEVLFAIGQGHRVVGVSAYVERPPEAKELPVVTAFVNGHVKKIVDLKPDLVLGFSDIQKDLARELIGEGLNVFIANHRTIDEIFDYITMLGNLVGAHAETVSYIDQLQKKLDEAKQFANSLPKKPKVYIEEWDDPMIAGIHWFNEVIELCGGELVYPNSSLGPMAKDRYIDAADVVVKNPEVILACWCGKKVDIESIRAREGWNSIGAIKNDHVFELKPEIFLQPGPAPIISGIDEIIRIFKSL